VPVLIEVLRGKDLLVRPIAVYTLGNIGPEAKDAVQTLIEALNDPDENVHGAALTALEKIGTPEALKALKDLSKKYKKREPE
jgi:HEAT repeat protein